MGTLPANIDAERFVLGSVLLDDSSFPEGLTADAFSIERHRRLWRRMVDLRARGERIDHVTVASEIRRRGEAEPDTLGYLVDLNTGLPHIPHPESYVRIIEETAHRRRIMIACQNLMSRAALGSEDLADIMAAGLELFSSRAAAAQGYRSVEELPTVGECGAADIEFLRAPELPRGAITALTGEAGSGKSTLATAWARDAWRNQGVPSLFLDRENPVSVIADRLRRLGMEDGPGLKLWGGWLPEQAPQPDSSLIRTWAQDQKGLIVLDSLSSFIEGDQNDAAIVRAFTHRARRLADAGATVIIIHHSGKAESARDYRGSSDFAASIDQGYHVASFASEGRLDKLALRPFKSRIGAASEIVYKYADGRFIRGDVVEARETLSDELGGLLRANPGVSAKRFEDLAAEKGLGRNRARTFLAGGVLSGAIKRNAGPRNLMRHYLAGEEVQRAL